MNRKMVAAFLVMVVCVSLPAVSGAETDNDSLPAKIMREAGRLGRSDIVEWRRAAISEDMARSAMLLKEQRRTREIDRKTIESVTALLDDHSDAVRSDAASVLGFIGPRARSAVPALRRALKRIQAEKAGREIILGGDSESAIRLALRRIAGIPDDLDR